MKFRQLSSLNALATARRLAQVAMIAAVLVFAAACGDNPIAGNPGQPDPPQIDATPDPDPRPDVPDVGDDVPEPPEDVPEPEDVPAPEPDAVEDVEPPEDVPDPEDVPEPDAVEDVEEGDADVEDEPEPEVLLRILSVEPDRGPVGGGTELIITVQGDLNDPRVQVDGRDATNVEVITSNIVIAVAPAGVAGPADVKVTEGAVTDTLPASFTYIAPLRVNALNPDKGAATGGELVEIQGEAFSEGVEVSFGGRSAISVQRVSDRSLFVITPPGAVGLADVRVTDAFNSAQLSAAYLYYDRVEIGGLFPAAGPRAGGEVTIMTGRGLTPDVEVRFGGLLAPRVTHINDQRLEIVTPPGPLGAVDVTVQGQNGTVGLPAGYTYLAQDQGDLVAANVQPREGPAAGGQEVIISGSGFDRDDLDVRFGNLSAMLIEVSDAALRVRTPAGQVGTVDVTVENEAGASVIRDGYTYLQTLSLAAIEPAQGPIEGGTPVAIFGEGFTNQTVFSIGPMLLGDPVVESATVARGLAPPGSLGASPVGAVEGAQRAVMPDAFLYTSPAEVTSLAPSRGSVAGGTVVTIRGRGFMPGAVVTFGGDPCANARVVDQATIVCTTAPHSEGAVAVRVTQGEDSALSPDPYIFYHPASRFGGAWGGGIRGSVNISVFSIGGGPVDGAFVMLSVDGNTDYQGFTSEQGLITFSGGDVIGNQFVSATASGFSSATVQAVNAENITILLFPTVPPSGGGGGGSLPLATITGQVSGFQKIGQPGDGERQIIIVETSRMSPTRPNPFPGNGNIVDPNGDRTYTLTSRTGDIAVIAWGGLINERTGVFTPYAIGIRRFLFVSQDQEYTVDLELTIDLTSPLTFKLVGDQVGVPGPNVNRVTPWVNLGIEGFFGNYDVAEGESDIIVAEHQPPLEAELANASFYIYGGSYTNQSSPYAQSVIPQLTETEGLIEMPPLVGVPTPLLPEDGGIARDGYVAFEPLTNALPDFWHVQIYQLPATLVWEISLPGAQTWFHLPRFPDFSDLPAEERPTPYAYGGNLYMIVQGARIDGFDFDQHEYLNDLRSRDRWVSWTRNAWFIQIE